MRQSRSIILSVHHHQNPQFTSPQQITERKAYIRAQMMRALGAAFPERAPLNASTVGVLERDGYRIEKVIFESQPKFYVTASLNLPTHGRVPFPAILFPLGHEEGAKAHDTWQQASTCGRRQRPN